MVTRLSDFPPVIVAVVDYRVGRGEVFDELVDGLYFGRPSAHVPEQRPASPVRMEAKTLVEFVPWHIP